MLINQPIDLEFTGWFINIFALIFLQNLFTLDPAQVRDFVALRVDDWAPREDEAAQRGTR